MPGSVLALEIMLNSVDRQGLCLIGIYRNLHCKGGNKQLKKKKECQAQVETMRRAEKGSREELQESAPRLDRGPERRRRIICGRGLWSRGGASMRAVRQVGGEAWGVPSAEVGVGASWIQQFWFSTESGRRLQQGTD